MYVDVGTSRIHPTFEVMPLMLHEGLPGHALQYAVARQSAPRGASALTTLLEQSRRSQGFEEGWGFYPETLRYNLGLYPTAMDQFGALRMQLTRAVRVVVDAGVHLSGWTLQQAKDYATATTGEPDQQVDLEVQRVIWPGEQPAYLIGEQQFLGMRELAAKKLGKNFDLASFHDTMLNWGPLPFEVLRRKLDDCLSEEHCAQRLSK